MKNETSEESLELKQAYQKGYADAMNWKTANHLEHLPAAQQQHNLKLMPREATREMLEAMDECSTEGYDERLYAGHAASVYMAALDVAPTLPKRKQEFIKHEVENADDWSEWVCPNPHKYLMKCCDCGLVHEAQFGVVRYKSEDEREACDFVDDPNLQAVFRMRRSEQWSPEDTAYRIGGLPMEQPEKELKNRIQALLMARELEAYHAEGPSKIATLLCDLVKQLEEYEQEIESLYEQLSNMELEK